MNGMNGEQHFMAGDRVRQFVPGSKRNVRPDVGEVMAVTRIPGVKHRPPLTFVKVMWPGFPCAVDIAPDQLVKVKPKAEQGALELDDTERARKGQQR